MKNKDKNKYDDFLDNDDDATVCDLDGNCVKKYVRSDKSIVERVNKTIIVEDGRQLLV